jgi:hypothetical protein
MVAEVRGRLRDRSVTDDVIAERVRARLGRAVSHPHAIEVAVRDGIATLSGPILADEIARLINVARGARGVKHVENRLSPHEQPDVMSLQGGRITRSEVMLQRWPPAARMASGMVSGAFLVRAIVMPRRGGLTLALIGCALALRAITNRPLRRFLATKPPPALRTSPRTSTEQRATTTGNGHATTRPEPPSPTPRVM